MNYLRILFAAAGSFVAYMLLGGLIFGVSPFLKAEFMKYPNVYRSQQGQMSHMPVGMAGMLLSTLALAMIYAMMYRPGYGLREGAIYGALIGLYAIGSFVVHNYVNLNIGGRLTAYSAVAYLLEWIAAGIVIGLVYRPAL